MLKKLFSSILVSLLLLPNIGKSLETSWEGINEAKIRIISPFSNTNSSNHFIVGLEYKLENNWKTYWKSPGAGGFPQEITYKNSLNIRNIEILWPTPKPFSILGLRSLGYENRVVFPIKFEIIDKLKPVKLNLKVHFLTCKDICIPVDVNLKLIIPFGEIAELTEHANLIEKYISLSPLRKIDDFDFNINRAKFFINANDALLELQIEKKHPFKNPKIYIDNNRIEDAISILNRYSSDETNFNLKNTAAQLRSFIDNK